MSTGYFIYNALIVNEDKRFIGCLKTRGEFIEDVYEGDKKDNEDKNMTFCRITNC